MTKWHTATEMADLSELNRCRLCSSQNNLTDIFESPNEELLRMVYACTSIRISFEKDFPCAVCSSCIRIVKQFYAYRQKCLDHDRHLKRLRGEADDDGDEMDDSLTVDSKIWKKDGEADDRQFYDEVRKQIQGFLKTQVKEVERKALEKVDKALKKRKGKRPSEEVLLQMTVDVDSPGAADKSVEYKQNESGADFAVELVPSDSEEDAKPSYSGFGDIGNRTGKGVSALKRKWTSDAAATSNPANSLEQQLAEAQKKIDLLMQLNYELELKQMGMERGEVVVPFQNRVHNFIDPVTVENINTRCPAGQEGDGKFISTLADHVWTKDELSVRSVRGKRCYLHPEASTNIPATPTKIAFIHEKLLQRIDMEKDYDAQRRKPSRVSRKLNEKMANLRRKQH